MGGRGRHAIPKGKPYPGMEGLDLYAQQILLFLISLARDEGVYDEEKGLIYVAIGEVKIAKALTERYRKEYTRLSVAAALRRLETLGYIKVETQKYETHRLTGRRPASRKYLLTYKPRRNWWVKEDEKSI